MTDKFSIIPVDKLAEIILYQYENKKEILGIPEQLFFKPSPGDNFRSRRYGQLLETPVGPAAGPHTQLAQNIIAAWLTGARYIELKTIQTLDELNVSKPCIDMADEGYNCEWSQELKIRNSFDQYLNAWILIHILKDKLGIGTPAEPGFIFNMSAGYDYQGILKDNVQWFLKKMTNAGDELQQKTGLLKKIYPRITGLNISTVLSNNITLSTMHGCPPGEIETIGQYLLAEKKLHTTVKMNPTLLGKEKLHEILSNSGFDTQVPDPAFEHDLKYHDAVRIIKSLSATAKQNGLHFGIKLTNTLESVNNKDALPATEKMVYMSGRALHPIAINIAAKLQKDFNGTLDISFSAGTDAFNISKVLSCGLFPATMSSDLLKPGGYGRLQQYITEIESAIAKADSTDLNEYVVKTSGNNKPMEEARLHNLLNYADETVKDKRYKRTSFTVPSIKTDRKLGYFDCVYAPCTGTCPTNQDIPGYMYYTATRQFDKAFEAILITNPFPTVTGMVCDHPCQTKCTRINYDEPLQIREIKRFVAERAESYGQVEQNNSLQEENISVAVIGAGLSGLTCGYILKKAGFKVDIFEKTDKPGGMAAKAIPSFRLDKASFDKDLKRILDSGVKIHYNSNIDDNRFERLKERYDFVYIAAGAQSVRKLNIEGCDLNGVLDPIHFLFDLKSGKKTSYPGKNVAVIGGGNTAMDVARAAKRLTGDNGSVTVIYRRTIREMPADEDEINAALSEGINILELTHPVKINGVNGNVHSVTFTKMKFEGIDGSGRPRPVAIENSEFDMQFDTVIPAIGQDKDFDFGKLKFGTNGKDFETNYDNIFIGGDAYRGAATAIFAIGDGRKVAEKIIAKAGKKYDFAPRYARPELSLTEHKLKRTKRVYPVKDIKPGISRLSFEPVSEPFTEQQAVREASRCLGCDEVCNICTTVCPNLALQSYNTSPINVKTYTAKGNNGEITVTYNGNFQISQKYQILHIADWCNECGNCNTFCPSANAPYKEKPHIYLNREAFIDDTDCYFIENTNKILYRDSTANLYSLTIDGNNLVFETHTFILMFDKSTFEITDYKLKSGNSFEVNTQKVVEMKIILDGAKDIQVVKRVN